MSAVIHVAQSDIILAKVAKFYVRNERSMLSIPSYQYLAVCRSNHIAHKWDKQYQQKQGDIPNIQNITGKSIETHLNNYSSYDKHASLQAAVSMNCLPDYQHKQRLSMACMRIHSGYVKHALVHHYKQLVSMNGLPDYQYRLRPSMANMYIVCIQYMYIQAANLICHTIWMATQ